MSRVNMEAVARARAAESGSDVFAESLDSGVPKKPVVKKPAAKKKQKAKRGR